jgi:hypothetical protein
MKTLIYVIVVILFVSATSAPDIAGTWTGTLEVQGAKLRVVFHVKKSGEGYDATMDSPDQNATGIAVSGVKYEHPNVRFDVAAAGAYYEGVLHAEKEITGKWVQAGTAFYLVLER